MKKRMDFTAVLSFTALLTGCDNTFDANEKSFHAAVADYLNTGGDLCLNIKGWPVDVSPADIRFKDARPDSIASKMEALESAGLVSSVEAEVYGAPVSTQRRKVRRYSLTPAAAPYIKERDVPIFSNAVTQLPFLCWGQKSLSNIVKWETPASIGTKTKAVVTYTYKIDNMAKWATRDNVKAVFPDVLNNINGQYTRERTIALYLSDAGWRAYE